MNSSISEYWNQIISQTKDIPNIASSVNATLIDIHDTQERISALHAEYLKLKTAINNARSVVQSEELHHYDIIIDTITNEITSNYSQDVVLRSKVSLDTAHSKYKAFREKCCQIIRIYEDIVSDSSTKVQDLKVLQNKLEQLKSAYNNITTEIESRRKSLDDLSVESDTRRRQCEEMDRSIGAIKKEIETTTKDIETYQLKESCLRASISNLDKQRCSEQRIWLDQALNTIDGIMDVIVKVSNDTNACDSLQKQIADMVERLESNVSMYQEREEYKFSVEKRISNKDSEEKLNEEINCLKENQKLAKDDIIKIKKKIEERQKQITDANIEMDQLEKSISLNNSEAQILSSTSKTKNVKLQSLQMNLNELNELITSKKDVTDILKGKEASLSETATKKVDALAKLEKIEKNIQDHKANKYNSIDFDQIKNSMPCRITDSDDKTVMLRDMIHIYTSKKNEMDNENEQLIKDISSLESDFSRRASYHNKQLNNMKESHETHVSDMIRLGKERIGR